jgi:hypothetical protein
VTVSHADTSAQASVNNSGRTYIQDVTLDTYGHVTGLVSATETVVNTTSLPIENSAGTAQFTATDTTGLQFAASGASSVAFDAANQRVTISSTDTNTTYSAGNGIGLTGTTFSVSAGGGLTQNATGLAHTDTSSQASLTALTGANVVSDIDLDTYGHVTLLATRAMTAADIGAITGNQTITLSGDVSGSGTTSIVVTVADDSHNHIISNVDGLQTALDGKLSTAGGTLSGDLKVPNLLPPTDNTGVVGDASFTWSNGQFTNLTVNGTLSVRAAVDLADLDQVRFGSSDDFKFYYDGAANEMEFEMEAACNQIRIHDNGTTRFTLERATGNFAATGDITSSGTGHIRAPVGTTAQRPASPSVGMMRYNSTRGCFEGYTPSGWVNMSPILFEDVGNTT